MINGSLLIVDDEPDMVEWLTAFFEDNGYSTISSPDGVDGFEKALSEKPDLITLDITMDRESGVGMYKSLKDNEETAQIPVVVVTGISPDIKRFLERSKQVPSPTAFFEKPINPWDDKLRDVHNRTKPRQLIFSMH